MSSLDELPTPRMPLRRVPWKSYQRLDCPVCGKPFLPWAGSYLPCHARCLFTDEQAKLIYRISQRVDVTGVAMAARLKISTASLRGVIARGRALSA